MSTTALVKTILSGGRSDAKPVVRKFFWETMGNDDTGASVEMSGFTDVSVQIAGTYNSATIVIEGSNDGTNWTTLNDGLGTVLSFTVTNRLLTVLENTRYLRPKTSGGSGTDLDVTMIAVAPPG